MASAQALRHQIETALAERVPAALTPAPRAVREVTSCGNRVLDQILKGGLPCSSITEFVGKQCSGRTTMSLAYIAAMTQAGNVCAWIDVANELDPLAVAANGVDLDRLLWVRCGTHGVPSLPASAARQACPERTEASVPQPRHTGGGSPHPRSEGRDMPQAILALLDAHGGLADHQLRREKKAIGTPGMPNRQIAWRSEHREEQVNSDRLPSRRGDNLPSSMTPPQRKAGAQPGVDPLNPGLHGLPVAHSVTAGKPWHGLDQALRATDLLLQGGGFSAIVLDLGSTPPDIVWRIPLATWFRFRAACDRTRVSLLLLTQHPCARSSAELVVRLETGAMEAQNKVMTGIRYRASTERSRFHEKNARIVPIRKPPQSERPGEWKSEAAWA